MSNTDEPTLSARGSTILDVNGFVKNIIQKHSKESFDASK